MFSEKFVFRCDLLLQKNFHSGSKLFSEKLFATLLPIETFQFPFSAASINHTAIFTNVWSSSSRFLNKLSLFEETLKLGDIVKNVKESCQNFLSSNSIKNYKLRISFLNVCHQLIVDEYFFLLSFFCLS